MRCGSHAGSNAPADDRGPPPQRGTGKGEQCSEEWLAHRFSLGDDDPDFLWVIGYLLRSAAARGVFAHDNFIGATVCRAHEMLGLIVVEDGEIVEEADGADAEDEIACVEVAEGAVVTADEADEEEGTSYDGDDADSASAASEGDTVDDDEEEEASDDEYEWAWLDQVSERIEFVIRAATPIPTGVLTNFP